MLRELACFCSTPSTAANLPNSGDGVRSRDGTHGWWRIDRSGRVESVACARRQNEAARRLPFPTVHASLKSKRRDAAPHDARHHLLREVCENEAFAKQPERQQFRRKAVSNLATAVASGHLHTAISDEVESNARALGSDDFIVNWTKDGIGIPGRNSIGWFPRLRKSFSPINAAWISATGKLRRPFFPCDSRAVRLTRSL